MRIVGIVDLSYRVCLNMVSCLVDRYAQVAQLVEQWTENPRVGGSNPPLGTIPRDNPAESLVFGLIINQG